MLLNSREFKFLKNYRNVYVKSCAKREYRDENVFLKGDRLQIKVVVFKKLYKFYIEHFLLGIIVFLINIKNAIE